MYRTILAPLDGSKRSESILPTLEELALSSGAMVILLRAVEVGSSIHQNKARYPEASFEQRAREAAAYLAVHQGILYDKGINCRIRVVHGSTSSAIVTVAEQEGVDVILMTTHGRAGLSRLFHGSVANTVIQRVDCPVILTRQPDTVL